MRATAFLAGPFLAAAALVAGTFFAAAFLAAGAAFTAVIQLGTMAAILLYFRVEIARILVAWTRGLRNPEIRKTLDSRLGWYIILGTAPIAITASISDLKSPPMVIRVHKPA